MRHRPSLVLAPIVLGLVAVSGCGSSDVDSPAAARLRALANLYLDCAVARNGIGPADEGAFKKYLRKVDGIVLQLNGIERDSIDSLFVSERDQEPLVVLYGVGISGMSGVSAPVVAHEKTGKNGKRLVVLANTKVEMADEARLQDLLAGKQ